MARVGVLGGTFDPVHVGHVLMASYVRERLPLDQVVLMPAALPPHKAPRPDMASAADRWEMVLRAVASVPGVTACPLELERPGPSYTIDTLRALRSLQPDWEIFLIIGEDNIGQVGSWHRPDLIMAACTVVAGTRAAPGAPPRPDDPWGSRIVRVATPVLEISSTEIRARVSAGKAIRYLVPEGVEQYIRARGLYGGGAAPTRTGP